MAISVIGRDITAQTNAQKLLEKAEEARKKKSIIESKIIFK